MPPALRVFGILVFLHLSVGIIEITRWDDAKSLARRRYDWRAIYHFILTIICTSSLWRVLSTFNKLQLYTQYTTAASYIQWFSVIKTKLLFAPAAILKRQILQATYLSPVCLYYSSIVSYCINLLQLFPGRQQRT